MNSSMVLVPESALSPAEQVLYHEAQMLFQRADAAYWQGKPNTRLALIRAGYFVQESMDELYGKLCAIGANKSQ